MPANQTKKPTYYQQIHTAQRNLTICKGVRRTVKAVIGYYLSRTNPETSGVRSQKGVILIQP